VTLSGWEGNRRPGGMESNGSLPPGALADCLYTGISSMPNEYERTLPFYVVAEHSHTRCAGMGWAALCVAMRCCVLTCT